jgi:hypothetical protein
MAWLNTFVFFCWITTLALFVPGVILCYIPARAATGELFLRTSRDLAIIAIVLGIIVGSHLMKLAL